MANKKTFKFVKFLALVFGLVLFASPFFIAKTNYKSINKTYAENYFSPISINSVNFDINVKENGVISVKQNFNVTFNRSNLHEIVFYIPYAGTIYRDDTKKVTKTKYLAKISNYKLERGQEGNEFLNFYHDEEGAQDFVTFGIYNSSGYVYGQTKSYTLYYDYDMKNKGTKDFDEVYFNLLGYNSPMKIENISFVINLPKNVDFNKYIPHFYYGEAGSVLEFSDFSVENGTTIKSNNPITLNEFEALTMRQLLPKGYLKISNNTVVFPIVAIILSVIGFSVVLVIKLKNRQRGEVVAPVEFKAPSGVYPYVAEYYIKETVTNKSAGAMIVYLANLGCLKIEVTKEEKNEKIVLKKIKDLSGQNDESLVAFFNSLFADSNEINLDDLNSLNFYNSFNRLRLNAQSKHGSRMYKPDNISKMNNASWISFLFIVINCGLLCLLSFLALDFIAKPVFLAIIFIVVPSLIVICVTRFYNLSSSSNAKIAVLIASITLISLIFLFVKISLLKYFDVYYLFTISNILLLVVGAIMFKPEYTESAAKTRGSVLGLKNYITLAEKDRLEVLVKDNPNYYFDILPYAYVLDVSDVWMDKFKDIKVPSPEWIESHGAVDVFDIIYINHLFGNINYRLNSAIQTQAVKQASDSSFGSSGSRSSGSGGGFSGGGGGGGSFGAR